MQVLITRPIEDSLQLATLLESNGFQVIIEPLIKIDFKPHQVLPSKKWQAITFTSANAIRSLNNHPQLPDLLKIPCFCVGPASADAARKIGFENIERSNGGVEELKNLIEQKMLIKSGDLLYVSGETISGRLEVEGFNVTRIPSYSAHAANELSFKIKQQLKAKLVYGALFYSARTANIWRELIIKADLYSEAKNIISYCLSDNVAAQLPSEWNKKVAPSNSDLDMLKILVGDK